MIASRRLSLATFGLGILSATLLSAREPTELEQYYLELINQARADPDAEVSRLSSFPWDGQPDLNEGLPAGRISNSPKPPLAFNEQILDAASDYSDLLLANEEFGHNFQNTTPSSRMTAAGYDFTAPSGAAENLASTARSPSNPLNASVVEQHHRNLFIDSGVSGRGHRITLMDPDLLEVGVAIRNDNNGISAFGPGFIDILSTQNFAYSAGRVFVTGVLFNDLDRDAFYTPDAGEAIAGATLEVLDSNGKTVASGTSFSSGGYSINLGGLPSGTYILSVTGPSGEDFTAEFVFDGSNNVKVDVTGADSSVLVKKKLKKKIKKLRKKLKKTDSTVKKQKYKKKIKMLKKKLRKL